MDYIGDPEKFLEFLAAKCASKVSGDIINSGHELFGALNDFKLFLQDCGPRTVGKF